jgi:predicted Zn finger-like uncharacterized protein
VQFSCDSCKTQLQIADEKVRGKRLIVRCKRCGAKITISDPALAQRKPAAQPKAPPPVATPAPAPAAAAPADPPLWFAMLHGKQSGPHTRADLSRLANGGEVGPRTYLWKEGMDSWQRAREMPGLMALFPQPPAPPMPPPPLPAADSSGESPPLNSSKELASWTNSDLGKQGSPGVARARPTDPALMAPRSRPVSSPPMFESAAPVRSRASFAVLLAVVLAAVAIAVWIFFGTEKKEGNAVVPGPPAAADASAPAAPPPPPPPKDDPPPAPQIEPATVPAAGLTADQVRKKLDDNKGALQGCIDDALKRDPNLRVGKIHLSTTIAPSGQVTAAKIDKRSVDEGPLGTCLKRATRKIAFPSFGGEAFEVDIPINVPAGD